eukprot:2007821-Rhodomonas_salina.6
MDGRLRLHVLQVRAAYRAPGPGGRPVLTYAMLLPGAESAESEEAEAGERGRVWGLGPRVSGLASGI